MNYARDLMPGEQRGNLGGIADVSLDKNERGMFFQLAQISAIARIGQLVETDDHGNRRFAGIRFEQLLANKIGADKARTAGDQKTMGARAHKFASGQIAISITASRASLDFMF
jgi:hypothetical protein